MVPKSSMGKEPASLLSAPVQVDNGLEAAGDHHTKLYGPRAWHDGSNGPDQLREDPQESGEKVGTKLSQSISTHVPERLRWERGGLMGKVAGSLLWHGLAMEDAGPAAAN